MAVLIHFPGNWESVFTLGKEPGHMWGMKRKTAHFFLIFFHFLRVSHCFFYPQLLNTSLNRSETTSGTNNHPQCQPLQPEVTCMEASRITAGTHGSSKTCEEKAPRQIYDLPYFFNFEDPLPQKKQLPDQRLVIILFL